MLVIFAFSEEIVRIVSVIDLKMPYMSITVQYIKTHTVVL